MSTSLFNNTPIVTVFDNRQLSVRDITYYRHPDIPKITEERITYHWYDSRSFLMQSSDARLYNKGRVNFTKLTNLAGNVLRTQSTDAGIMLTISDVARRPHVTVTGIGTTADDIIDTNQAVICTYQYEDNSLLGRLLSVTELMVGKAAHITERFIYASNSQSEQERNLAGQCISHYDTAGLKQISSLALTNVPLFTNRRSLRDADDPTIIANWHGNNTSAWDALLDNEEFTTQTTVDSTGTWLTTTDALGNQQFMAYNPVGLLSRNWLMLKGGQKQVIVKSITYSAAGKKLREEHGNGVVTTYTYEPETQRLVGILTKRPISHTSGAKVLQDLRYDYDPVGNVLSVTNDSETTRFWRNQKIVPKNIYTYDSLYQLVSTTGREMANIGQQSNRLPTISIPLSTDSAAYTNYTRTYTYDIANNMAQIRHSASATNNNYTIDITIGEHSNRGVLSTLTKNASDVDALFTLSGHQKLLQPGQNLIWTSRGELMKVTSVTRDKTTDDSENYRYDASSQRILKIRSQQKNNIEQTHRTLYLPGLELRTTINGSKVVENLQVIVIGGSEQAQVRVLHWDIGKPDDISNNQIRWSYSNLTGNNNLEVDGDGNLISLEEYYPYGGTALITARSQTEADYKTVRYSGKEQDATGLYYYSYRYYQPWATRWLSADPAGTLDGLNLFRMVRNNPITLKDGDGLWPWGQKGKINEEDFNFIGIFNLTKALSKLPAKERERYGIEGIMESLAGASQVVSIAISRLSENQLDPDTQNIINDIFAHTTSKETLTRLSPVIQKDLLTKLTGIKKTLGWNIENKGEEIRFQFNNEKEGILAWVTPDNDSLKNIIHITPKFLTDRTSISVKKMTEFANLSTFIHEASHFQGTLDHMYLIQPRTENQSEYFNNVMKQLHSFNLLVGGKSDPRITESLKTQGLDTADEAVRKAERIKIYGNKKRLDLALNNADHIATLTLRLGL